MNARRKSKIVWWLALFAMLGVIVGATRALADEGRERDSDRDRDDERNECLVPEASTGHALIVIGAACVAVGAWSHYRRNRR